MPPSPLPGPVGDQIKRRLESAAIRFQQLNSWEELRMYILQDEKWEWDADILLGWQPDITVHFLERCKPYHTADAIRAFALALEDGQQLAGHSNGNEAGDLLEEDSDHGTITQPEYSEIPRPERVIFVVRWGNKDYDGLAVKYTKKPMSRISDKIVMRRWGLERDIYPTLVGNGATGRMVSVIDLTWEGQSQGTARKSETTTFEVVPDENIQSDVEFGQNMSEPTCSSRQARGHSVTKSLSTVEPGRSARVPPSRSHTGNSASGSSHRPQTAPSRSGRPGSQSKDEFVRQKMLAYMRADAEAEWDKEHPCGETDADDDGDSYVSSKGYHHSSPQTSISSKNQYPR